jgi:ABC-type branched-subunit amino acid transport system ATPase component
MSPEESTELMLDLRRIRETEYRQLSIILVEHDMSLVMGSPMKSWSSIMEG